MTRIFKEIFLDSPVPWQTGFQNPATATMENIILLHSYIIMHLILVSTVVCWFLLRSIFLFRLGKNKTAMEFSHDPVIETVWTVAPVFILISIIVPSFSLLYSMEDIIEPDITVKIIGRQWYWSYELDSQQKDSLVFVEKLGLTYVSPKKSIANMSSVNPIDWVKLKEWHKKVLASLSLKVEKTRYEQLVEDWEEIKASRVRKVATKFGNAYETLFRENRLGWLFDFIVTEVIPWGIDHSYDNPKIPMSMDGGVRRGYFYNYVQKKYVPVGYHEDFLNIKPHLSIPVYRNAEQLAAWGYTTPIKFQTSQSERVESAMSDLVQYAREVKEERRIAKLNYNPGHHLKKKPGELMMGPDYPYKKKGVWHKYRQLQLPEGSRPIKKKHHGLVNKAASASPKSASSSVKVVPPSVKVDSSSPKVVSPSAKVDSSSPKVVSPSAKVDSSSPKVVPPSAKVDSSSPKVVSSSPKAAGSSKPPESNSEFKDLHNSITTSVEKEYINLKSVTYADKLKFGLPVFDEKPDGSTERVSGKPRSEAPPTETVKYPKLVKSSRSPVIHLKAPQLILPKKPIHVESTEIIGPPLILPRTSGLFESAEAPAPQPTLSHKSSSVKSAEINEPPLDLTGAPNPAEAYDVILPHLASLLGPDSDTQSEHAPRIMREIEVIQPQLVLTKKPSSVKSGEIIFEYDDEGGSLKTPPIDDETRQQFDDDFENWWARGVEMGVLDINDLYRGIPTTATLKSGDGSEPVEIVRTRSVNEKGEVEIGYAEVTTVHEPKAKRTPPISASASKKPTSSQVSTSATTTTTTAAERAAAGIPEKMTYPTYPIPEKSKPTSTPTVAESKPISTPTVVESKPTSTSTGADVYVGFSKSGKPLVETEHHEIRPDGRRVTIRHIRETDYVGDTSQAEWLAMAAAIAQEQGIADSGSEHSEHSWHSEDIPTLAVQSAEITSVVPPARPVVKAPIAVAPVTTVATTSIAATQPIVAPVPTVAPATTVATTSIAATQPTVAPVPTVAPATTVATTSIAATQPTVAPVPTVAPATTVATTSIAATQPTVAPAPRVVDQIIEALNTVTVLTSDPTFLPPNIPEGVITNAPAELPYSSKVVMDPGKKYSIVPSKDGVEPMLVPVPEKYLVSSYVDHHLASQTPADIIKIREQTPEFFDGMPDGLRAIHPEFFDRENYPEYFDTNLAKAAERNGRHTYREDFSGTQYRLVNNGEGAIFKITLLDGLIIASERYALPEEGTPIIPFIVVPPANDDSPVIPPMPVMTFADALDSDDEISDISSTSGHKVKVDLSSTHSKRTQGSSAIKPSDSQSDRGLSVDSLSSPVAKVILPEEFDPFADPDAEVPVPIVGAPVPVEPVDIDIASVSDGHESRSSSAIDRWWDDWFTDLEADRRPPKPKGPGASISCKEHYNNLINRLRLERFERAARRIAGEDIPPEPPNTKSLHSQHSEVDMESTYKWQSMEGIRIALGKDMIGRKGVVEPTRLIDFKPDRVFQVLEDRYNWVHDEYKFFEYNNHEPAELNTTIIEDNQIKNNAFTAGKYYLPPVYTVFTRLLWDQEPRWWLVDPSSRFFKYHFIFEGWGDVFTSQDIIINYNSNYGLISEGDKETFAHYTHTNTFSYDQILLWKFAFDYDFAKLFTPQYRFRQGLMWISPMIKFDSFMMPEAELPFGGLRLLEVDHKLVLPIKTNIRLLVTSADVIHSWAVPSLGVKVDAIPGRLNQANIHILRAGKFYGQCSELCGTNHSNMPIVVEGVKKTDFNDWLRNESSRFPLNELIESKSFSIKIKG